MSSIHLPDPSEVGLFNAPIRPRRRNYRLLGGQYTYVQSCCSVEYSWLTRNRKFEYGDSSTALFHFGVLLDPLSEAAQKWTSLLEVCGFVRHELYVTFMPCRLVVIERPRSVCRVARESGQV